MAITYTTTGGATLTTGVELFGTWKLTGTETLGDLYESTVPSHQFDITKPAILWLKQWSSSWGGGLSVTAHHSDNSTESLLDLATTPTWGQTLITATIPADTIGSNLSSISINVDRAARNVGTATRYWYLWDWGFYQDGMMNPFLLGKTGTSDTDVAWGVWQAGIDVYRATFIETQNVATDFKLVEVTVNNAGLTRSNGFRRTKAVLRPNASTGSVVYQYTLDFWTGRLELSGTHTWGTYGNSGGETGVITFTKTESFPQTLRIKTTGSLTIDTGCRVFIYESEVQTHTGSNRSSVILEGSASLTVNGVLYCGDAFEAKSTTATLNIGANGLVEGSPATSLTIWSAPTIADGGEIRQMDVYPSTNDKISNLTITKNGRVINRFTTATFETKGIYLDNYIGNSIRYGQSVENSGINQTGKYNVFRFDDCTPTLVNFWSSPGNTGLLISEFRKHVQFVPVDAVGGAVTETLDADIFVQSSTFSVPQFDDLTRGSETLSIPDTLGDYGNTNGEGFYYDYTEALSSEVYELDLDFRTSVTDFALVRYQVRHQVSTGQAGHTTVRLFGAKTGALGETGFNTANDEMPYRIRTWGKQEVLGKVNVTGNGTLTVSSIIATDSRITSATIPSALSDLSFDTTNTRITYSGSSSITLDTLYDQIRRWLQKDSSGKKLADFSADSDDATNVMDIGSWDVRGIENITTGTKFTKLKTTGSVYDESGNALERDELNIALDTTNVSTRTLTITTSVAVGIGVYQDITTLTTANVTSTNTFGYHEEFQSAAGTITVFCRTNEALVVRSRAYLVMNEEREIAAGTTDVTIDFVNANDPYVLDRARTSYNINDQTADKFMVYSITPSGFDYAIGWKNSRVTAGNTFLAHPLESGLDTGRYNDEPNTNFDAPITYTHSGTEYTIRQPYLDNFYDMVKWVTCEQFGGSGKPHPLRLRDPFIDNQDSLALGIMKGRVPYNSSDRSGHGFWRGVIASTNSDSNYMTSMVAREGGFWGVDVCTEIGDMDSTNSNSSATYRQAWWLQTYGANIRGYSNNEKGSIYAIKGNRRQYGLIGIRKDDYSSFFRLNTSTGTNIEVGTVGDFFGENSDTHKTSILELARTGTGYTIPTNPIYWTMYEYADAEGEAGSYANAELLHRVINREDRIYSITAGFEIDIFDLRGVFAQTIYNDTEGNPRYDSSATDLGTGVSTITYDVSAPATQRIININSTVTDDSVVSVSALALYKHTEDYSVVETTGLLHPKPVLISENLSDIRLLSNWRFKINYSDNIVEIDTTITPNEETIPQVYASTNANGLYPATSPSARVLSATSRLAGLITQSSGVDVGLKSDVTAVKTIAVTTPSPAPSDGADILKGATADSVADAVWDENRPAHNTINTMGAVVNEINDKLPAGSLASLADLIDFLGIDTIDLFVQMGTSSDSSARGFAITGSIPLYGRIRPTNNFTDYVQQKSDRTIEGSAMDTFVIQRTGSVGNYAYAFVLDFETAFNYQVNNNSFVILKDPTGTLNDLPFAFAQATLNDSNYEYRWENVQGGVIAQYFGLTNNAVIEVQFVIQFSHELIGEVRRLSNLITVISGNDIGIKSDPVAVKGVQITTLSPEPSDGATYLKGSGTGGGGTASFEYVSKFTATAGTGVNAEGKYLQINGATGNVKTYVADYQLTDNPDFPGSQQIVLWGTATSFDIYIYLNDISIISDPRYKDLEITFASGTNSKTFIWDDFEDLGSTLEVRETGVTNTAWLYNLSGTDIGTVTFQYNNAIQPSKDALDYLDDVLNPRMPSSGTIATVGAEMGIDDTTEIAIAERVWDRMATLDAGTGSFGKILNDLAARLPSTGTIAVQGDAMDLLSATEDTVVDKVWDEARVDHVSTGSTGQAINDMESRLPATGTLSVQGDEMDLLPATENTIADKVWDEAKSDHNTSGTTGEVLNDLQPRLPSAGTLSVQGDEMDLLATTENTIADKVLDEAISGHNTTGTVGEVVNDLSSRLPSSGTLSVSGDNMGLTSAGVDAVWDELLSGHTTTGSTGKKLADLMNSAGGGGFTDTYTSSDTSGRYNATNAIADPDGNLNTQFFSALTGVTLGINGITLGWILVGGSASSAKVWFVFNSEVDIDLFSNSTFTIKRASQTDTTFTFGDATRTTDWSNSPTYLMGSAVTTLAWVFSLTDGDTATQVDFARNFTLEGVTLKILSDADEMNNKKFFGLTFPPAPASGTTRYLATDVRYVRGVAIASQSDAQDGADYFRYPTLEQRKVTKTIVMSKVGVDWRYDGSANVGTITPYDKIYLLSGLGTIVEDITFPVSNPSTMTVTVANNNPVAGADLFDNTSGADYTLVVPSHTLTVTGNNVTLPVGASANTTFYRLTLDSATQTAINNQSGFSTMTISISFYISVGAYMRFFVGEEAGGTTITDTDKNEIADRVWDELASAHTTTGSFGKFLGDLLSTDILGFTDSETATLTIRPRVVSGERYYDIATGNNSYFGANQLLYIELSTSGTTLRFDFYLRDELFLTGLHKNATFQIAKTGETTVEIDVSDLVFRGRLESRDGSYRYVFRYSLTSGSTNWTNTQTDSATGVTLKWDRNATYSDYFLSNADFIKLLYCKFVRIASTQLDDQTNAHALASNPEAVKGNVIETVTGYNEGSQYLSSQSPDVREMTFSVRMGKDITSTRYDSGLGAVTGNDELYLLAKFNSTITSVTYIPATDPTNDNGHLVIIFNDPSNIGYGDIYTYLEDRLSLKVGTGVFIDFSSTQVNITKSGNTLRIVTDPLGDTADDAIKAISSGTTILVEFKLWATQQGYVRFSNATTIAGSVSLTTAAVNSLVDAIWDEALSGHVVSGSAGKKLGDIDDTTIPTVVEISDGVWDEIASGHSTAGSFGKIVDDLNTYLRSELADGFPVTKTWTATEGSGIDSSFRFLDVGTDVVINEFNNISFTNDPVFAGVVSNVVISRLSNTTANVSLIVTGDILTGFNKYDKFTISMGTNSVSIDISDLELTDSGTGWFDYRTSSPVTGQWLNDLQSNQTGTIEFTRTYKGRFDQTVEAVVSIWALATANSLTLNGGVSVNTTGVTAIVNGLGNKVFNQASDTDTTTFASTIERLRNSIVLHESGTIDFSGGGTHTVTSGANSIEFKGAIVAGTLDGQTSAVSSFSDTTDTIYVRDRLGGEANTEIVLPLMVASYRNIQEGADTTYGVIIAWNKERTDLIGGYYGLSMSAGGNIYKLTVNETAHPQKNSQAFGTDTTLMSIAGWNTTGSYITFEVDEQTAGTLHGAVSSGGSFHIVYVGIQSQIVEGLQAYNIEGVVNRTQAQLEARQSTMITNQEDMEAKIDVIDTNVDDIEADTTRMRFDSLGNILSTPQTNVNLGAFDRQQIQSIKDKTDDLVITGGKVSAHLTQSDVDGYIVNLGTDALNKIKESQFVQTATRYTLSANGVPDRAIVYYYETAGGYDSDTITNADGETELIATPQNWDYQDIFEILKDGNSFITQQHIERRKRV